MIDVSDSGTDSRKFVLLLTDQRWLDDSANGVHACEAVPVR